MAPAVAWPTATAADAVFVPGEKVADAETVAGAAEHAPCPVYTAVANTAVDALVTCPIVQVAVAE